MNNEDFNYIPRSAARLRNRDISDQHQALLKTGNPASAADFIEQKLVFIEQQLSGKNREIYNVYSDTEPSSEEMEGKFFWNKEY